MVHFKMPPVRSQNNPFASPALYVYKREGHGQIARRYAGNVGFIMNKNLLPIR